MRKILFSALIVAGSSFANTNKIDLAIGGTGIIKSLELGDITLGVNYIVDDGRLSYRVGLDYIKVSEDPTLIPNGVSGLIKPTVAVMYNIPQNFTSVVKPYVLAGAGYEKVINERKGFSSHPILQLGGGLDFAANQSVDVFGEYKYTKIIGGLAGEDFEHTFMVGARIDINPASKPIAAAVVIRDSDGDGVTDDFDRCPNTFKEFTVGLDGCAKKVDFKVEFPSNSSVPLNFTGANLNQLSSYLKSNPKNKVVIEGHTDNVGNSKKNLELSKARSVTIQKELLRLGVNPAQISIAPKGDKMPIASNSTAEGRAKNRRVIGKIYTN